MPETALGAPLAAAGGERAADGALDFAEAVAQAIADGFDPYDAPALLDDVILRFARAVAPGLPDTELTDRLLERRARRRLLSALLRAEAAGRAMRVLPRFEVQEEREIVGFGHPRAGDSPLTSRVREVAAAVPGALTAIRGLTPREFEQFCARLLTLLGASSALSTRYSNDGGVDFLGWLHIPETLLGPCPLPSFRAGFKMLVVGQAKRYRPENPVGVETVRELVGTTAAFHHDQLAPWESKIQLPREALTLMAPMLPLLVTTGRITEGARLLADRCGVVTRDGADLALFICLEGVGLAAAPDVGDTDPSAGGPTAPRVGIRPTFDDALFRAWLGPAGGAVDTPVMVSDALTDASQEATTRAE